MDLTLLLGLAAVILPVLTYFAGVQRGRHKEEQHRSEQEVQRRQDRIHRAAEKYVENVRITSGIQGALAAGVAALDSAEDVRLFLDEIEKRGVSSPFPKSYRSEVSDDQLLAFYRECAKSPREIHSDSHFRRIIEAIQPSP